MSANQYGPQLGQALMEAGITQLSFSLDAHVSPESVSAYKNGRAVAPPDIKSKSVLVTDNPFLAMSAMLESAAGTGPVILDGERMEINRHTVLDQTKFEMQQLLKVTEVAEQRLMRIAPGALSQQERQDVEALVQEAMDVVTAAMNLVAVLCREYKISWIKHWTLHHSKLAKNGLLKMINGGKGK
ncbi:XRE family transcriptional regulator [Brevibacillus sp. SIMBA_040]|uniref:XRE family transcriptional regulator n=1 Tax=unclassified Brevibacillus TaxID=2684853 RepID=UPI00397B26FE